MSEAEARALARKNGYGLVELLQGGVWAAALCCPLRELRQADGGARGRRRLRLHLLEVEEIDGAEPLRQGTLNKKGILAAPP